MKKNVLLVIFIIISIVGASLAVYFGVNYSKLNKKENVDESESVDNMKNNGNEETTNQIQEVEKVIEKYKRIEFNGNKCLNNKDGAKYSEMISDTMLGVDCSLNDDKKTVTLGCNVDMINKSYGLNLNANGNYTTYNITNFSNRISDIKICTLSGQTVGYEVILFLMEDGNVEYMPLYKAFKNNDIRSYGLVKDVSSIVKISNANCSNQQGQKISSRIPVAIKEDGSFYDLYNILSNTEDFKF